MRLYEAIFRTSDIYIYGVSKISYKKKYHSSFMFPYLIFSNYFGDHMKLSPCIFVFVFFFHERSIDSIK